MPVSAVIHLENPNLQLFELSLFSKNGKRGFEISYDRNTRVLAVDRSLIANQVNAEYGTVRKVRLDEGLSVLDVYVDHSTVEIFANEGEKVISARVFPEADEKIIRMGGRDINLSIYRAEKTNDDSLII